MKPWNHCAATVLGLFHMTTRPPVFHQARNWPPPKDKLSSGSEDTATQEPGHGRDGCDRPGPGPGGVPGRPPAAWGPLAAPLAAASPGGWGCASRGAGGRPPGTPRPTRAAPRPSPRGCSRSAWCVPPHPMRYAAPLDSPRAGGLVRAAGLAGFARAAGPSAGALAVVPGPAVPPGAAAPVAAGLVAAPRPGRFARCLVRVGGPCCPPACPPSAWRRSGGPAWAALAVALVSLLPPPWCALVAAAGRTRAPPRARSPLARCPLRRAGARAPWCGGSEFGPPARPSWGLLPSPAALVCPLAALYRCGGGVPHRPPPVKGSVYGRQRPPLTAAARRGIQ